MFFRAAGSSLRSRGGGGGALGWRRARARGRGVPSGASLARTALEQEVASAWRHRAGASSPLFAFYKVTREGPRRSVKRRQRPARPQSGAPNPAVLPSPIPSVAIATPILLHETGSHRPEGRGGKGGGGRGGVGRGGPGWGGRTGRRGRRNRRGTDRERRVRLKLSRATASAAAAAAAASGTTVLQNSLQRPASEEGPRAVRSNSGSRTQSPGTATCARERGKPRPDPHTRLRVLTGPASVRWASAPPPPGGGVGAVGTGGSLRGGSRKRGSPPGLTECWHPEVKAGAAA